MSDIELGVRLALSLLFGTVVGIERQWHHKNAGIKTNTLVAVGSTSFALVSQHGFGPNSNPAQIAAGVVTGIGFIGAGVIMRRGGSVQGINSAATLWATASMGLAIGEGYYSLAPLILTAILIVQVTLHWLTTWVDKRSGLITPLVTYHVQVNFNPSATEEVRAAWSAFAARNGVSVTRYSETLDNSSEATLEASFGLSETRAGELPSVGQKLAKIPGVTKARWSQTTIPEGNGHEEG